MPSPRIKKPPKYAFLKRVALGLPGTHEEPHKYGIWFNIGKKTFALYWFKGEKWILRLPHDQIMMLVDAAPDVFSPMKNAALLWVYVDVTKLSAKDLRAYLEAAWRYTAPKKLQAQAASRKL